MNEKSCRQRRDGVNEQWCKQREVNDNGVEMQEMSEEWSSDNVLWRESRRWRYNISFMITTVLDYLDSLEVNHSFIINTKLFKDSDMVDFVTKRFKILLKNGFWLLTSISWLQQHLMDMRIGN